MSTKSEFNFKDTRIAIQKQMQEFPKEIAEIVKDDSVNNIISGGFYGKTYKPRKDTKPHPILRDTGNLLNAVNDSVRNGNVAGKDSYDIKVNNFYGIFHNEGTSKIPQRQFMGESPIQVNKVTKFITDKLDKIFEEN